MNSLDRFPTLTDQQTTAITGGDWKWEIVKGIGNEALHHIDDIIKGFNAGNHRHLPRH